MAFERDNRHADAPKARLTARGSISPEWLFAAAIVLLGGLAAWRLAADGYLPQPFYFRVDETLMDLYTTAYWAGNSAAYTVWRSVYPPLSFVFLDIVSNRRCYMHGAEAGRLCDWGSAAALISLFFCNIGLVFASYRWMPWRVAVPRAIAVCLGLPMLYALERGNLLIPCFTCFVLAFSDLLRWRGARWLAMALSMNFKPYLVFAVLPFVGRRAYLGLIACALLFVTVYGVTYLIQGHGSPLEVIANETNYAVVKVGKLYSDLYFATAYWPLIRLLRAAPAGLVLAAPGAAGALSLALEIAIRLAQVCFFACSAVALLRPALVDVRRFGAMVACISLTAFTSGSAGYVQIFLFFLLFYEPWRGPTRIVILTCAYLLCLPMDFIIAPVMHDRVVSFLTAREVVTNFGVSVGQLVRPGLLLVIQFGLIGINVSDLLARGDKARRLAENPSWYSAPGARWLLAESSKG